MYRDKSEPPSFDTYYERIFAKTASLFALCTEAGALLAGCPSETIERSRRFGRLMGEAFQIADDVLDIIGDETKLGKPIAADLRQGLLTLPVLYYHQTHPNDKRIQQVLTNHLSKRSVTALAADIKNSNAPHQAMQQAEQHIQEAGELLTLHPDSVYRQAMEEIASFAVRRRF
jgi:geranylgeranyl pyrophosphate synthase